MMTGGSLRLEDIGLSTHGETPAPQAQPPTAPPQTASKTFATLDALLQGAAGPQGLFAESAPAPGPHDAGALQALVQELEARRPPMVHAEELAALIDWGPRFAGSCGTIGAFVQRNPDRLELFPDGLVGLRPRAAGHSAGGVDVQEQGALCCAEFLRRIMVSF